MTKYTALRRCFGCNIPLSFGDYCQTNIHKYKNSQLKKIWNNENVELYCCECYKNELERQFLDITNSFSVRKCAMCHKSVKIKEFKKYSYFYFVDDIINFWKGKKNKVYCEECHNKHQKMSFMERHSEEIKVLLKNVKYPDNDFIRNIMNEVKCLIPQKNNISIIDNGFILEDGYLRLLKIEHTELTSLPRSTSNLKNLEILKLSNNRLSKIPIEVGSLNHLRELRVGRNKLTKIPFSISELKNLRKLDISANNMKRVPESIYSLKNLRYLDLSYNPLIEISESLSYLNELKFLYIIGMKHVKIPESVKDLQNKGTIIIR
ncbi:MAG: hypothetical protein GF317_20640 [Candidatus Lokiarchaeota archaeon]|nr:hypothetical protein [Candidatus Lokiarchaeota archaeon]MBD3201873.1 hypothetical protein [Candidatus Lokiarchaeota archaeon]